MRRSGKAVSANRFSNARLNARLFWLEKSVVKSSINMVFRYPTFNPTFFLQNVGSKVGFRQNPTFCPSFSAQNVGLKVGHCRLSLSTGSKPVVVRKQKNCAGIRFPRSCCFQFISDYQRAALAFSTREVKPAASVTAISERTLRSSSIPAFLRPFMNLE